MKKWATVLGFLGLMSVWGLGQTLFGGQVLDGDTGEELIGATIILYQAGQYVQGINTDFNGHYSASIDPGIYDVEVSYIGYPSQKINGVVIEAGRENTLTVQMILGDNILFYPLYCPTYVIPIIERDCASSGRKIEHRQIENRGDKNLREIILNAPGISF